MDKASETLATRIREAHDAITDLEGRLQAIAAEKAAVLGAEALDLKSTQRLDSCEQTITAALATQRARLGLLQEQVAAAETTEAEQRIAGIEADYQLLATTLATQHQEWIDGLAQLAALFAEAQAGKAHLQLLRDEGAFLVEKYGTRWPNCPPVPVPQRDDITRTLEEGLRKAAWHIHRTSVWKEQTDRLKQQRNVAAAAGIDPRRGSHSQGMVRMYTPPFVAGPKV